MKKQTKKPAAAPPATEAAADGNDAGIVDRNDDGNEDGAGQGAIPDDVLESPTHGVTSPKAEHLNDRMKLARKPNDAEPLAHRNRSKAGRKG